MIDALRFRVSYSLFCNNAICLSFLAHRSPPMVIETFPGTIPEIIYSEFRIVIPSLNFRSSFIVKGEKEKSNSWNTILTSNVSRR